MKTIRFPLLTALMLLWASTMVSQDCTLGIGGPDTDVIVKVFHLSSEQQLKMNNWAGELALYHKDMASQIRELFDTHPQQNKEDLEQLAAKYKVLRDEIVATAKSYDRKLISIFNAQQYERYQALCTEARRQPITIQ